MKIIFFDHTDPDQRTYVQERLKDHVVEFIEKPVQDVLVEELPDMDIAAIFVGSKFTGELFLNAPQLKYITTRSTGFDHIDLQKAAEKNVLVSNVPFYGSNTVAEHAIALLLALTRKIPESVHRVKDGSFTYQGLQGVDLMERTLGIVGGGHIGLHVAQIAKGFGMKTFVYDLHQDEQLAQEYGFTYESDLDKLLGMSDVISLHLPLNEHTQHIINQESIQKIKEGAYLINTARGGLVETDALVQALNSGKLAGVGLDVLEGEEFLQDELSFLAEEHTEDEVKSVLEDHVLIEMDNVIVTPHNAFNTKEAHFRNLETTVNNILSFIDGNPQNIVKI
ncbi:hydroxyacid dehydrogenase [candidate division WWE3 bacterium]|uniref:Hydroxyacid dehydrogenase n=1 Tax=candidate division WWE3 bacterium TaxID=2053526 RepID=A0A955LGG7_UNCKA|nr:hydroxyacid dehydrogenase [candidate division WWE3 bacterium]